MDLLTRWFREGTAACPQSRCQRPSWRIVRSRRRFHRRVGIRRVNSYPNRELRWRRAVCGRGTAFSPRSRVGGSGQRDAWLMNRALADDLVEPHVVRGREVAPLKDTKDDAPGLGAPQANLIGRLVRTIGPCAVPDREDLPVAVGAQVGVACTRVGGDERERLHTGG